MLPIERAIFEKSKLPAITPGMVFAVGAACDVLLVLLVCVDELCGVGGFATGLF